CPFCVGGLEAPEPYTVRAFENRWPPLVPGDAIELEHVPSEGPFATRPPRGAAEVVLYTPEHDGSSATLGAAGVRAVVDVWAGHPFATLLAPRTHVPDLSGLDDAGRDGLATALVDVVGRYDRLYDAPLPYLMWIHPGVHLHVHFAPVHRAPGVQRYVASAEVGAAMLFNPVAPEAAAALLRDA